MPPLPIKLELFVDLKYPPSFPLQISHKQTITSISILNQMLSTLLHYVAAGSFFFA